MNNELLNLINKPIKVIAKLEANAGVRKRQLGIAGLQTAAVTSKSGGVT